MLFVYQVTGDAIARIFGIETGREQGEQARAGARAVHPGAGQQVVRRPGRARARHGLDGEDVPVGAGHAGQRATSSRCSCRGAGSAACATVERLAVREASSDVGTGRRSVLLRERIAHVVDAVLPAARPARRRSRRGGGAETRARAVTATFGWLAVDRHGPRLVALARDARASRSRRRRGAATTGAAPRSVPSRVMVASPGEHADEHLVRRGGRRSAERARSWPTAGGARHDGGGGRGRGGGRRRSRSVCAGAARARARGRPRRRQPPWPTARDRRVERPALLRAQPATPGTGAGIALDRK